MRNPLVSVILPVYNGETHLSECIKSVLYQTFTDFEFIIVDDASTDKTPSILNSFAKQDSRIKIISNKKNQRQTISATIACQNAQGKYIARIDADDVALQQRLERQVQFLENNPDFGLVGSWSDRINDKGDVFNKWIVETNPLYLKWAFLFQTNFAHASVMMQNDIVKEVGYYQSSEAEDFDLWSRMGTISKIGCIPEVLQQRRVWDGQLNLKVPTETLNCVYQIIKRNIELLLGKKVSLNYVKNFHSVITHGNCLTNINDIIEVKTLILELFNTFKLKNNINRNEKQLISRDVVHKLFILKLWLDKINKSSGLILFLQIVTLNIRFATFIILQRMLGKNLVSIIFPHRNN